MQHCYSRYLMFLLLLPFFIQMVAIGIDEIYFHYKRGLPLWERIGHPLDTLTVISALSYICLVPYSPFALKIYIGISVFSCVFVTKDEFVHKHYSPAAENWLHAFLFLLHPIVLTIAGWIWRSFPELMFFLYAQLASMILFCLYQGIYWNVFYDQQ